MEEEEEGRFKNTFDYSWSREEEEDKMSVLILSSRGRKGESAEIVGGGVGEGNALFPFVHRTKASNSFRVNNHSTVFSRL